MTVVKFGKYKGQNIESVDDNYLSWIIDAKQKELTEFHKEFIRRNPDTPESGWYHPVIQAGKQQTVEPPLKIPPQTCSDSGKSAFDEPVNFGKEDLAEEDESGDLIVLTKAQLKELVAHSVTSGYSQAYDRMAVNVLALPYGEKFRTELLANIRENRKIDSSKFKETKKAEAVGDTAGEQKTKRPWFSQDLRKK